MWESCRSAILHRAIAGRRVSCCYHPDGSYRGGRWHPLSKRSPRRCRDAGIAVDPAHIPLDDPALQALVRANQRALQTIVEQPRLAVKYIASFLDRLTSEEAQQYYERYIGPYFTSGGRVDRVLADAVHRRSG
jgi:hypothetical protein